MQKDISDLLSRHRELIHSEMKKVVSHTQRETKAWILNTLMIEGCDAPFRYKRTKRYRNLENARVNLTYYAATEVIAGMEVDVMNVVRIKRA